MSARTYSTRLESFVSSSDGFQVVNTSTRPINKDKLYVLDSSFNPPTKAHLALALSSLPHNTPSTVLLVLAIQNADKEAKPATFDHRLAMMDLLAHRIEATSATTTALIALSKHARFVDKAKEIEKAFPATKELIWLVGYDTLIRIVDKKYYTSSLEDSLKGFLHKNRLVCAIRGDEVEQRAFVDKIRAGEINGVPASIADYITLIEPVGKEASSTRARTASANGRVEEIRELVPEEIAEYIEKEQLYKDE
jgi:nicotinamide-nucleotide adenylyltransferase